DYYCQVWDNSDHPLF
nr:immunoglobulin light chain junction region [Macaca mulatta]MOW28051.1 immunoglobulin light chain junction region [Macaca mulatta]MOW28678.1 immunoglobulin light chain junction region [Macaca mulatta]MOW29824.1 immunoglobulin light chain junction region [Macaca mulatta]MOW30751.1 immunoglobulin light chain junction region [Macaca mulatta]